MIQSLMRSLPSSEALSVCVYVCPATTVAEPVVVKIGATSWIVTVVVVSFALTTLASATRLLRFNISEIGETLGVKVLDNRYLASALAVGVIAFFAFYEIGGRPAGLALWRLFGTTNQLLAGLALLAVTLYLVKRRRNPWFTGVPMLFMLASTVVAMLSNLRDFWRQWDEGGGALFVVGLVLLVLWVWPGDSPLRAADGSVTSFSAPIMQSIVPLIFLLFLVPGAVYGYVAGTVKSHRDLIQGMSKTMATMGYYLTMIFFCAQFTAAFGRSNLGALLAVKGADVVVHAAAVVSLDRASRNETYRANLAGAKNVLGCAAEAGVNQLIHVSSSSVFAIDDRRAIDLDAPLAQPSGGYGASKVAIELFARGMIAAGSPLSILYPVGIYGGHPPALDTSGGTFVPSDTIL